MNGVNLDELFAEDVTFDNDGNSFRDTTDTVKKALLELRLVETLIPGTMITTTLNGTKFLVKLDNTFQLIDGSATGFTVTLPVSTDLIPGRRYEILNTSSEQVDINDGSGTKLTTLNAGDLVWCRLQSVSGDAGIWTTTSVSANASGITSYSIGSDTLFSTSSATDVVITGMSVTPVSGRYACYFSSDIEITQNNKLSEVVFYKAGTALERSRRVAQGVSSNFVTSHNMLAEISVNGSESIDVRVNISSGSSVDVNQRRMILIRLGT